MNPRDITLHTERLVLKVIDQTYADRTLDYFRRNRTFLKSWEPVKTDIFYTLEFQREQLKKDLLAISEDRAFKFWIFKKESGLKRIIGSISLTNIVRGGFQSCFLGYRLDEKEVRNGYMFEGLKAAIDFAFQRLKLHRLEANIRPVNTPSLKLVEKLGFYHEGLARDYLRIDGKWEDHIHMVLLNEEME